MPIYEYRCPNGHTFELFQKMTDPPAETCTICGEGPVEKLLFPVAVHFKGSGFYSTDYGRGKKKAKETEGSTDSKSDTTGEKAKPAEAKPKPKPASDGS